MIRKPTRFLVAGFALSFATSPTWLFAMNSEGAFVPGPAIASRSTGRVRLENRVIIAKCTTAEGRLTNLVVVDRMHGAELRITSPFAVQLNDGTILSTEALELSGPPVRRALKPSPGASRRVERVHGEEFDFPLENADRSLRLVWSLVLRDGSSYLKQVLAISAAGRDVPVRRVTLLDLPLSQARVSGSVGGSPVVAGNWFAGFEHPLSKSKVADGRAAAWIDRDLPVKANQSVTYSSVIGVARTGQMRRDFSTYIERERAHPYRTFLHYNSWYDLGYFTPYDQANSKDRVEFFGRELSQKRGVRLDSFLFDDGWDRHHSLWQFNDGFPDGFAPIKQAAEKYGADPGVWMSPWGGYSVPKKERVEFGQGAGYEIVRNGYALSGPKYYTAFLNVCKEMIRKFGVNQFKFDGTGNVDSVFPGSRFDSDFDAAISLIGELRAASPDIYINLTTGTWPSPFWLMYADSIWRGGEDDSLAGVGTNREQWITYRDAQTYQGIVQKGPLFPLNSLMLHGLIYARYNKWLNTDPGNDFRNEVRSYFGTGTQLQEMYITPSLLTDANWDDLAEAAKWSRSNADVLKDSHWIGGDPAQLEVYGWASWTPRKGILVLRNPSSQERTFSIKLKEAFELPPEAVRQFVARSPWKEKSSIDGISLNSQETHAFDLAPFEVLTLDLVPR